MRQSDRTAARFWQRSILIVGALLCLCVSDSAGPRLRPLPSLSVPIAVSKYPLNRTACASEAPRRDREPSAYNKIVAGTQYRARERDDKVQPATHAPQTSLQLQTTNLAGLPAIYAPLNFKTPSLSLPMGRAPPYSA